MLGCEHQGSCAILVRQIGTRSGLKEALHRVPILLQCGCDKERSIVGRAPVWIEMLV